MMADSHHLTGRGRTQPLSRPCHQLGGVLLCVGTCLGLLLVMALSHPVFRPKLNAFLHVCQDQVSHIKPQIVE
jgi:hypothetical protein